MNIVNILQEIEKVDGEIYERLSPRRTAMKDFFNMGKKVSLAALPIALGSMFQKAYGQTNPGSVTDVLKFALALEYLEYNFYNRALNSTIVFPNTASRAAITTIRDHERQHVDLLKGALGITGADEYVEADFDFTGAATFGTAFADVFSNYQTFLKVATAFEDTGVRAYKGQAPVLIGMPVLTTALQIHAVEARHASHLRQMTAAALGVQLKPWIAYAPNGNDTGIAQVDSVYAGEQNTTILGIQITGINGTAVTQTHAAECFDEFLTGTDVKKIANIFIRTKKLS